MALRNRVLTIDQADVLMYQVGLFDTEIIDISFI